MVSAGAAPPPVQAFGALIASYARASLLDRALGAMKEFCRRGGVPDAAMVGSIVPLCLKSGSYRKAVQVQCPFLRDSCNSVHLPDIPSELAYRLLVHPELLCGYASLRRHTH